MAPVVPLSQEDKDHLLGELPLRPQHRRRVADWVASQVLANPQEELEVVTSKLYGLGFDIVEWPINSDGDLMLCYLGRLRDFDDQTAGATLFDSFLISFAGHDSAQITIYNQEDQWEL